MMRTLRWVLLLGIAPLVTVFAQAPVFEVSEPATIINLDMGSLKGTPWHLAWSPDGGELYFQTAEGYPPTKYHHYSIHVGDAKPKSIDAEPDWAKEYWTWKSARNAPGDPELLIAAETVNKLGQMPTQSLHEKGTGMSNGQVALAGAVMASDATNNSTVITLSLKGEVVGKFIDHPVVPGLMFGWSPVLEHGFAYVNQAGRLSVLDIFAGAKQEIATTKEVMLPAWSMDGTKIAFLQHTDHKHYSLDRITIGLR